MCTSELSCCQTVIRDDGTQNKLLVISPLGDNQSLQMTPQIQLCVLFFWNSIRCFMALVTRCGILTVTWYVDTCGVGCNVAFIESHLSAPSCITVCDRVCWIEIESGAERRRGCVRSPCLTACHFQLQRAITQRVWPSLGQRGTPCKYWMWN